MKSTMTRSARAANARYWKQYGEAPVKELTAEERAAIASNREPVANETGVGITMRYVRKDKKGE